MKKAYLFTPTALMLIPIYFMSMLGMSALNEIVIENGETSPEKILNKLRGKIISAFEQSGGQERKDGMDIGLCVYNASTKVIEFSGAYNSMYLVRKTASIPADVQTDGQFKYLASEQGEYGLLEFSANKMPVGKHHLLDKESFTKQSFPLQEGDRLYVFSDGFVDQFGGEQKRKYMSKRFKKFILDIQHHDMHTQNERLSTEFNEWMNMGGTTQIDDICIVGVEV